MAEEQSVKTLDDIAELQTPEPISSNEQNISTPIPQYKNKIIRNIHKLSEISYPETWESIVFDGIIVEIVKPGNRESRSPGVIKCKILESNEFIELISWEYDSVVEKARQLLSKNIVFHINADAGFFKRKERSIRCTSLIETEQIVENNKSTIPHVDPNDIKIKINKIIDKYVTNVNYRKILQILFGEKFYIWPAAINNHHNFKHGLALHSYTVAYTALQLAAIYMKRVNIDIGLLITGALLHDIGKLEEYEFQNEIPQINIQGNLMSHIASGVQMITTICHENSIDPYSIEIKKLIHIILSHHGQLEYGSTNMPSTMEANIVAIADRADSQLEQIVEKYATMNQGEISSKIYSLDGTRLIKF